MERERNEISLHEVKLYLTLKKAQGWITAKELAVEAGIADRTARAHLVKLTELNVVDMAEVFPSHRYRLSEKASKRNNGYMTRLTRAIEVFGLGEGAP